MSDPDPIEKRSGWKDMLEARLVANIKAEAQWSDDRSELVLRVPTRKPGYLIPPISWIIRPPRARAIVLDRIGGQVWAWCDGTRTVEQVIELFALEHNLTFHESRVSVTTYLKDLVKRGTLAVAFK